MTDSALEGAGHPVDAQSFAFYRLLDVIIITAILFVELTQMEEFAKVMVIPGLITSIAASIYLLYRMFR